MPEIETKLSRRALMAGGLSAGILVTLPAKLRSGNHRSRR